MPLKLKQVDILPKDLPGKTTSLPASKKIRASGNLGRESDIPYRGDVTYDIPEFKKFFNVVDPDTGETVGIIRYPHDVCPGLNCPASEGKSHALSFFKKGCFYIHSHCGLPNVKTASSYFKEVVEFKEGYLLPWEKAENEEDSTH